MAVSQVLILRIFLGFCIKLVLLTWRHPSIKLDGLDPPPKEESTVKTDMLNEVAASEISYFSIVSLISDYPSNSSSLPI